jgi:hypothetical protein
MESLRRVVIHQGWVRVSATGVLASSSRCSAGIPLACAALTIVSIRAHRHHRVVDHLVAGDVHRRVVLGAVRTYNHHALLAIAGLALSSADLPPRGAVHFIDDPPNDVIWLNQQPESRNGKTLIADTPAGWTSS